MQFYHRIGKYLVNLWSYRLEQYNFDIRKSRFVRPGFRLQTYDGMQL